MTNIPQDVMREIAKYLPYNDRINMNLALPLEYQYVKKIDSDNHNLTVKVDLMTAKLENIKRQPYDSLKRIKAVKRMLLYILHTKDQCLFTRTAHVLMQVFREKARYFADPGNYLPEMFLYYRRDIKSLIRVAEQLHSYLDTKTLNPTPGKCVLVEII